MESGKFSDLTLCLQDGTTIKCHRLVMCTQCEFFDVAVKPGQFKVCSLSMTMDKLHLTLHVQESSGNIKLENDPPQAIRSMVEFLYTGKYTTSHKDLEIPELSPKEYAEAMCNHVDVYIVSVVYRIPELQEMASKSIKLALTDRALSVLPWLFNYVDSSVPASVCSLRGELIKFAEKHVVELTSGNYFRNMMDVAPALMEKVMHDLAKSREHERSSRKNAERRIGELEAKVSSCPTAYSYRCPSCFEIFDTVMPAWRVRVGCPGCGVTRLTTSWDDLKLEPSGAEDLGSSAQRASRPRRGRS